MTRVSPHLVLRRRLGPWGTLLASLLLMGLQAVLYGQGQPHF